MTIVEWVMLFAVLAAVVVLVERFIRWIKSKERRRTEGDE